MLGLAVLPTQWLLWQLTSSTSRRSHPCERSATADTPIRTQKTLVSLSLSSGEDRPVSYWGRNDDNDDDGGGGAAAEEDREGRRWKALKALDTR
jgi:hypothetical protein